MQEKPIHNKYNGNKNTKNKRRVQFSIKTENTNHIIKK